jgi:hypothetical protein
VTEQAENWGRPLGGTDFPLARTGGGLACQKKDAVVADGLKSFETMEFKD